jgi:hypothetical protein
VDAELNAMMIEVLLHLVAVQVEDVEVHYCKAAAPAAVAAGQLSIGHVKDAIEKLKVVLNLLVAADGEARRCGLDGGSHIRHDEHVE